MLINDNVNAEYRPLPLQFAASKQRIAIVFMHLTAFLLLAYKPNTFLFDYKILANGAVSLIVLLTAQAIAERMFENGCHLLWNCVFFLVDIGIIFIQRIDALVVIKQIALFGASLSFMILIPIALKFILKPEKLEFIYLILGVLLIISPFIFGKRTFGAVNWATINGITFQPSEVVKFLFVLYLASAFKKEKAFPIFPSIVAAFFMLALVVQRDLGGALIFFTTFMTMLYISNGKKLLFCGGLGLFSVASVVAYKFFDHVKVRVAAWQNPFKDIDGGGYQIVQSLFAIGTWGMFGRGLTRGLVKTIPVAVSDLIFAAICEEMGTIFGLLLIFIFIVFFYRSMQISLNCNNSFYKLATAGFCSMIMFQAFLILGGVLKIIPLTGVTLPFVSYGGSSILVSMLIVCVLQYVANES